MLMLICATIINLISLFLLICALNNIRTRYKQAHASFTEKLCFKSAFVTLNLISLLICLYFWQNPGWLIWINLTSIDAFILALWLGFYPNFYIKWIGLTSRL